MGICRVNGAVFPRPIEGRGKKGIQWGLLPGVSLALKGLTQPRAKVCDPCRGRGGGGFPGVSLAVEGWLKAGLRYATPVQGRGESQGKAIGGLGVQRKIGSDGCRPNFGELVQGAMKAGEKTCSCGREHGTQPLVFYKFCGGMLARARHGTASGCAVGPVFAFSCQAGVSCFLMSWMLLGGSSSISTWPRLRTRPTSGGKFLMTSAAR
jgi:hypothetical protein